MGSSNSIFEKIAGALYIGNELLDQDGNIFFSMGTTLPTDTTAGYSAGGLFLKTDGPAWYINEGSTTSCDFDAVSTA